MYKTKSYEVRLPFYKNFIRQDQDNARFFQKNHKIDISFRLLNSFSRYFLMSKLLTTRLLMSILSAKKHYVLAIEEIIKKI